MGETERLIRRARARITGPEHWTQFYLARDAEGKGLIGAAADSPRAVAWCHNGAYLLPGGAEWRDGELERRETMSRQTARRLSISYRTVLGEGWRDRIVEINNGRNAKTAHHAVLKIMDQAAQVAAEKGW